MIIFLTLFSYFLGSIPFGLIITYLLGQPDPRFGGSGNIGATNVARLAGKFAGILTLFLDIAKGYISMILAINFWGLNWEAVFVGLVVFLGHCYPLYLKFKGGKGVATALGVFFAISPCFFLCWLFVWVIIVIMSGYISVGSIGSYIITPFIMIVMGGGIPVLVFSIIIAILVIWRHRTNIIRLYLGEEELFLNF